MRYNNISSIDKSGNINVIIEIAKCSDPIKYEVDKDSGLIVVDRFIPVSMHYPCNYGFIPNTLGGDGDPIDVLLISEYPIMPGAAISAKVVGVLMMEDESGLDEKIIAVPSEKVDVASKEINDIEDISKSLLNKISHFFERYKDLEKNKWVRVSGIQDKDKALAIIKQAIDRQDS